MAQHFLNLRQDYLPLTQLSKKTKAKTQNKSESETIFSVFFLSRLNFGAFFFTEKHKLLFFAAALFYSFIYLFIFHSIYFIKTLFVHVF